MRFVYYLDQAPNRQVGNLFDNSIFACNFSSKFHWDHEGTSALPATVQGL